ncbi:hypothetical protein BOTNAR_0392g00100 [Botryotinia narcissicola]|uniref:Uncharacterized protein n=1 Tax=Botryotinia narcissicola TaxID=278944 RepID=A0A4Z1HMZ1_9HELO|nr:hypothetical protein BOTNAR_0392g00100 [Botryotinia narcissicola]
MTIRRIKMEGDLEGTWQCCIPSLMARQMSQLYALVPTAQIFKPFEEQSILGQMGSAFEIPAI